MTNTETLRAQAAVAAHMAVHCRGKWLVQLQDGYISATSSGGEEIPADHLDLMKVVADAKTSRNIDVLLGLFGFTSRMYPAVFLLILVDLIFA
jgi:hypothetical protein